MGLLNGMKRFVYGTRNPALEFVKSNLPSVNEPMALYAFRGQSPEVDYNTLWMYLKSSPEVIACITAIVEDILSDGWTLEGAKSRVEPTEKWLSENRVREVLWTFLYDAFVTGDAYLFKNKLSQTEIKGAINRAINKLPYEVKSDFINEIWNEVKSDEDIFSTRSFIPVAASTMKMVFSETGDVEKYIQSVSGLPAKEFSVDEIIHFRLMTLDGKMYGFSPLRSITRELDILLNVKDYTRYFFEKGGLPNFLFILKNVDADSDFFKVFVKKLEMYSNLTQRYKSLVVAGDVEAHEITKLDKDMEFRELARYITQIMVMTWGVPANRLSDALLIGMKASVTSNEGYYRKISHYQDVLEDLINSQLLADRKVKLRFRRTYKQDEIRTVQIDKIKSDVVEQRFRIGMVDREWARKYLDIPHENFPDDNQAQQMRQEYKKPSGFGQQEQLNKMQTLSESEQLADNQNKQSIALEKKSKKR